MKRLFSRIVAVGVCLSTAVPDPGSRVPSQDRAYFSRDTGRGTRDLMYSEQALAAPSTWEHRPLDPGSEGYRLHRQVLEEAEAFDAFWNPGSSFFGTFNLFSAWVRDRSDEKMPVLQEAAARAEKVMQAQTGSSETGTPLLVQWVEYLEGLHASKNLDPLEPYKPALFKVVLPLLFFADFRGSLFELAAEVFPPSMAKDRRHRKGSYDARRLQSKIIHNNYSLPFDIVPMEPLQSLDDISHVRDSFAGLLVSMVLSGHDWLHRQYQAHGLINNKTDADVLSLPRFGSFQASLVARAIAALSDLRWDDWGILYFKNAGGWYAALLPPPSADPVKNPEIRWMDHLPFGRVRLYTHAVGSIHSGHIQLVFFRSHILAWLYWLVSNRKTIPDFKAKDGVELARLAAQARARQTETLPEASQSHDYALLGIDPFPWLESMQACVDALHRPLAEHLLQHDPHLIEAFDTHTYATGGRWNRENAESRRVLDWWAYGMFTHPEGFFVWLAHRLTVKPNTQELDEASVLLLMDALYALWDFGWLEVTSSLFTALLEWIHFRPTSVSVDWPRLQDWLLSHWDPERVHSRNDFEDWRLHNEHLLDDRNAHQNKTPPPGKAVMVAPLNPYYSPVACEPREMLAHEPLIGVYVTNADAAGRWVLPGTHFGYRLKGSRIADPVMIWLYEDHFVIRPWEAYVPLTYEEARQNAYITLSRKQVLDESPLSGNTWERLLVIDEQEAAKSGYEQCQLEIRGRLGLFSVNGHHLAVDRESLLLEYVWVKRMGSQVTVFSSEGEFLGRYVDAAVKPAETAPARLLDELPGCIAINLLSNHTVNSVEGYEFLSQLGKHLEKEGILRVGRRYQSVRFFPSSRKVAAWLEGTTICLPGRPDGDVSQALARIRQVIIQHDPLVQLNVYETQGGSLPPRLTAYDLLEWPPEQIAAYNAAYEAAEAASQRRRSIAAIFGQAPMAARRELGSESMPSLIERAFQEAHRHAGSPFVFVSKNGDVVFGAYPVHEMFGVGVADLNVFRSDLSGDTVFVRPFPKQTSGTQVVFILWKNSSAKWVCSLFDLAEGLSLDQETRGIHQKRSGLLSLVTESLPKYPAHSLEASQQRDRIEAHVLEPMKNLLDAPDVTLDEQKQFLDALEPVFRSMISAAQKDKMDEALLLPMIRVILEDIRSARTTILPKKKGQEEAQRRLQWYRHRTQEAPLWLKEILYLVLFEMGIDPESRIAIGSSSLPWMDQAGLTLYSNPLELFVTTILSRALVDLDFAYGPSLQGFVDDGYFDEFLRNLLPLYRQLELFLQTGDIWRGEDGWEWDFPRCRRQGLRIDHSDIGRGPGTFLDLLEAAHPFLMKSASPSSSDKQAAAPKVESAQTPVRKGSATFNLFLGGVGDSAANMAVVVHGQTSIAIDAGTEQERLPEFRSLNRVPPLKALFITHLHRDHFGGALTLFVREKRQGRTLPILAPPQMCRLMPILLRAQRRQVNPHAPARSRLVTDDAGVHLEPVEELVRPEEAEEEELPLSFDKEEIDEFLANVHPVAPGTIVSIESGLKVQSIPVGHWADACGYLIYTPEGNTFYTGDLLDRAIGPFTGFDGLHASVHTLIIGAKDPPANGPESDIEKARRQESDFVKAIVQTLEQNGQVLVALNPRGPVQVDLHIALQEVRRYVPDVPIVIDGIAAPLTAELQESYPTLKGSNVHLLGVNGNAAGQRMQWMNWKGPLVILAGQKDLRQGTSPEWAHHLLPDRRNTIIFHETHRNSPAEALLRAPHDHPATVLKIPFYFHVSGDGAVYWATHLNGVRSVVLIHQTDPAIQRAIEAQDPHLQVHIPELREIVRSARVDNAAEFHGLFGADGNNGAIPLEDIVNPEFSDPNVTHPLSAVGGNLYRDQESFYEDGAAFRDEVDAAIRRGFIEGRLFRFESAVVLQQEERRARQIQRVQEVFDGSDDQLVDYFETNIFIDFIPRKGKEKLVTADQIKQVPDRMREQLRNDPSLRERLDKAFRFLAEHLDWREVAPTILVGTDEEPLFLLHTEEGREVRSVLAHGGHWGPVFPLTVVELAMQDEEDDLTPALQIAYDHEVDEHKTKAHVPLNTDAKRKVTFLHNAVIEKRSLVPLDESQPVAALRIGTARHDLNVGRLLARYERLKSGTIPSYAASQVARLSYQARSLTGASSTDQRKAFLAELNFVDDLILYAHCLSDPQEATDDMWSASVRYVERMRDINNYKHQQYIKTLQTALGPSVPADRRQQIAQTLRKAIASSRVFRAASLSENSVRSSPFRMKQDLLLHVLVILLPDDPDGTLALLSSILLGKETTYRVISLKGLKTTVIALVRSSEPGARDLLYAFCDEAPKLYRTWWYGETSRGIQPLYNLISISLWPKGEAPDELKRLDERNHLLERQKVFAELRALWNKGFFPIKAFIEEKHPSLYQRMIDFFETDFPAILEAAGIPEGYRDLQTHGVLSLPPDLAAELRAVPFTELADKFVQRHPDWVVAAMTEYNRSWPSIVFRITYIEGVRMSELDPMIPLEIPPLDPRRLTEGAA